MLADTTSKERVAVGSFELEAVRSTMPSGAVICVSHSLRGALKLAATYPWGACIQTSWVWYSVPSDTFSSQDVADGCHRIQVFRPKITRLDGTAGGKGIQLPDLQVSQFYGAAGADVYLHPG